MQELWVEQLYAGQYRTPSAAIAAAFTGRSPAEVVGRGTGVDDVGLAPEVRPYLIAAHRSQERGHRAMLEWLGLSPLVDLDMRLGEGTGAALGISLAEAACKVLSEMATFGEAGVSDKA
jgi:NaMN:DMB phosphoribosyltransferase